MTKTPYFDNLPLEFNQQHSRAIQAFDRHLHWGYWPDPSTADGSGQDFVNAAEELSIRVTEAGGLVKDGLAVLDAGCGFGGTVASMNERFSNLSLVGLNIDSQQLSRAREKVQAKSTNQIEFVQADACQLPFADHSFDVVLALECIFAFPSRERFFQEVKRVLRPEGRLAICDFLPRESIASAWGWVEKQIQPLVGRTYGAASIKFCSLSEYKRLAEAKGFTLVKTEDITRNTLPTYPVVHQLMRLEGNQETFWATKGLEFLSYLGLLQYVILSYELPARQGHYQTNWLG